MSKKSAIVRWDATYDVVVVGYGGAGASAAISASDHSAGKVLLVEKLGEPGGTTAISTGLIMVPSRDGQGAVQKYVERLTGSVTDAESISAFVREARANLDWLETLGASFERLTPESIRGFPRVGRSGAGFPAAEGSSGVQIFTVKGEGLPAENLFRILRQAVEKRRVRVSLETSATQLVLDRGKVKGILLSKRRKKRGGVVSNNGKRTIAVRTLKGVILACGGFEYDEELKKNYLPMPLFGALGSPGNTGDGIRMAVEAGAQLWHMNAVSAAFAYKIPGIGFVSHFMPTARFIYVDQDGRRFCDESGLEGHTSWMRASGYDTKRLRYPGIPSFVVFDEAARKEGPIGHFRSGAAKGASTWSVDNSGEVAKGWISTAESLEQLASKLGIDPADSLVGTITRYNEACRSGVDPEFHRSAETLKPIDSPPYYGIAIWEALGNTQGGPRRNPKCQVLDTHNNPIPGLYSAGSLGSIWGFLYQGGGNIAECLASGRVAGREVVVATSSRGSNRRGQP